jgi:transcriptional regulator with XRE-family HTH domain
MTAKEALFKSGRNLRMIREGKGFSVAALAVLSNVDDAIIDAIEEGDFDFPVSIVFELADALNVDFRQILVDPTGQTH